MQKAEFDDSLSSLSIESEDDTNLLTQAIAAGFNKKKETSCPINIPASKQRQDVANESISSVDSCGDRDDATNSILEQCIQSGINQVVKKDSSKRPMMTSSPKKSMLPTFRPSGSSSKKSDDEDLLSECIASGMLNATKQQANLVQSLAQLSITDSKNGQTTSVIAPQNNSNVLRASVTGVDNIVDHSIEKINHNKIGSNLSMTHQEKDQLIQAADESNIALEREISHQTIWTTQNGSSSDWNLDDNILERSNEYPANNLSMIMLACSENDDEINMELSNEFMMENEEKMDQKIEDKHKNPDLMLKSVDRLTQELVSTAEYLRKHTVNSEADKMSSSISNNTWNDENSFPSISMSAPMIASTNDEATFTIDHVQPITEEVVDGMFNDLNEKTPTNEEFKFKPIEKIDFKVGGEIVSMGAKSKINFLFNGPASIDTCSTMSNSTIVQVEARKIANKLQMEGSTTSLMDLENVRPPSSMDSISLCSYQDLSVLQSPIRCPQKKSLITGK